MKSLINSYIRDSLLNLNWGTISFLAHRITGIAISVYLFLHIYTLSHILAGIESFNEALKHYDNLFGHTLEYLLLIAVLIHAINGIRIIIADFCGLTKSHKKILAYGFILLVAILIFSVCTFIPEINELR